MPAQLFQNPKFQITLKCLILPPVAMGDVYRIVGKQPTAIGIIDGYFDGVPAVWHKEILWAMSKGLPVIWRKQHGCITRGGIA